MSEKITYTNENDEKVIFELKKPYILLEKSGFGGIENKISSEKLYGMDGEYEYDASLPPRPLSVKSLIYGDTAKQENELRKNIMRVTNPKLRGKITYELFDSTYEIDVRVSKSWDDAYHENPHILQGEVEFIALNPYWRDISSESYTVMLGQTINCFSFPLAITDNFKFAEIDSGREVEVLNPGDVTVGIEFNISCTASVKNPRILNMYTQEFFGFNATFSTGDHIYVNTNKGKKQVLINNENGYSKKKAGSVFLQLENHNTNYFILQADEGVENMVAEMKFYPLLAGV